MIPVLGCLLHHPQKPCQLVRVGAAQQIGAVIGSILRAERCCIACGAWLGRWKGKNIVSIDGK
ncbi:hypothetical protein [Magnetospirillum moscoviense]|uniref:hypothetical protein n=1 Tax=Magnetospirillum moscoviense TaxID=1437059 RepID=UPI0012E90855|nr:hypothetical protein [Magnetospirillum moscoviense]